MSFSRLSLLSAVLLFVIAPGELSPQAAVNRAVPGRVPVTVVLTDRLPVADAPFVVQRRADLAPHDIILLRSDANAAHLSEAVWTVLAARQAEGDTPRRSASVRMRPHSTSGAGRRELPWASRVLSDLKRARKQEVPGVGGVQAVEIWLPPQGRRARQAR